MKERIFKIVKRAIIIILTFYVLACILLYFFQEKLIFHPEKVPKSTNFDYEYTFVEKFYEVEQGIELNTLLFPSASNDTIERKLVFFIHGNSGTLQTLGGVAPNFTDRGYDCFLYDYRGYGKSEGTIDSEEQLFHDAQVLYDEMKKIYKERNIIIVGYSLGSGIGSWLASENKPKALILEAPYFGMTDMMRHRYPIIPTFLLRYPLQSANYVNIAGCPVYIFHGDKDESIPYSNSVKLVKMRPSIQLTTLKGVDHEGFSSNETYRRVLTEILNK